MVRITSLWCKVFFPTSIKDPSSFIYGIFKCLPIKLYNFLTQKRSYKSFLAVASIGRYQWLFNIRLVSSNLTLYMLDAVFNTGCTKGLQAKIFKIRAQAKYPFNWINVLCYVQGWALLASRQKIKCSNLAGSQTMWHWASQQGWSNPPLLIHRTYYKNIIRVYIRIL